MRGPSTGCVGRSPRANRAQPWGGHCFLGCKLGGAWLVLESMVGKGGGASGVTVGDGTCAFDLDDAGWVWAYATVCQCAYNGVLGYVFVEYQGR